MKKLVDRFWNEPAFCLGVLGTVAMIVLKVVAQSDSINSIDDLAQILTPIITGLLTRRLVTPAYKDKPNTMYPPKD